VANWLFAQTTHVVGSKSKFAWWVACGISYVKCDPNRLRGDGAVGVENGPFLLLWPVAYRTACISLYKLVHVQAVNKSITSKAMQYRQDIFTRMSITRVELLITVSIVTIRSIWHNSVCGRFFFLLENFRRKLANIVAPTTDGTTKRLVYAIR